ncbi:MAG: carboxypeptidase regulatory-like domain-containing protein [Kiritimatiellia bacterium]
MKTRLFRHRVVALAILWVAAALSAFAAEPPREAYRNALYLERGAGDPAAALVFYEQVANDPAAAADLAAQARWRSGLCLEQLGRRTEAAARHAAVLGAAPDEASDVLRNVREAAARSLLRLAEEEAHAGAGKAPPAAEWMALVQTHFPRMAEQIALERAAMRRTLRGVVDTWDGRRPVYASVRIRARPESSAPVEARSTWRTQTDADGRFSIDLPLGRYEVRVWAPAYERAYASAELTPEEESPPEIRRILPRIRLPAAVDRVDLVGSFLDDWEGVLPLVRVGEGVWEVRRRLGPGRHEYKFSVNAEASLITDVAAAAFAADSHDDFNARIDLDQEQEIVFRFDENDPHFERGPGEKP